MDSPLTHKMSNGSSVADWLGTARTATAIALGDLDAVRFNRMQIEVLHDAACELRQALSELNAVRTELGLIRPPTRALRGPQEIAP